MMIFLEIHNYYYHVSRIIFEKARINTKDRTIEVEYTNFCLKNYENQRLA